MEKAIIGRKVGMTQVFDEQGKAIGVTVIEAGPCSVVQVKTVERDGYSAVQLGFKETKKTLSKGELGHLKKAGVATLKHLREFKLTNAENMNPGDEVKVDVFAEGDRIDATGISKGKGFAGTIKRHNFSRGRMSHGGGPVHRHQGSMGANSDPSRVFPGKKMPGHMGSEQVTTLNLEIVKIDSDLNLIAVRGAIPGPRGALITLRNTVMNNKK
ncbi:MAG: 50S ribosomal protein L3 [Oscillospiraceae bacterium]|nr:50S ribosomal protein L3 [Oscillospiraceae bacterium]